jgi:hypothetical protein
VLAAAHRLLAIALALAPSLGPRGFRPPRTHKVHPADETDRLHEIWDWMDDHGDVVFPLLGLAIIALVIFGIRRGMSSNVSELQEKQTRKEAIIRLMRAKLLVTADAVATELGVDRFAASGLLDELVREGKLLEQKGGGGVANYRLKGL